MISKQNVLDRHLAYRSKQVSSFFHLAASLLRVATKPTENVYDKSQVPCLTKPYGMVLASIEQYSCTKSCLFMKEKAPIKRIKKKKKGILSYSYDYMWL